MPTELVKLEVKLVDDKAVSALESLDKLREKLDGQSITFKVDTSSLERMEKSIKKQVQFINQSIRDNTKSVESYNSIAFSSDRAAKSIKEYGQAIATVDPTPLQKQIEALTGVDRAFKSAEASAKAILAAEQKLGNVTGDRISTNISTAGMEEYIRTAQGLEDATVKATRVVRIGDNTFQQFSVSAKNAAGDVDKFTYSVDTATGTVYRLNQGIGSSKSMASSLKEGVAAADDQAAAVNRMADAYEDAEQNAKNLLAIQKKLGENTGNIVDANIGTSSFSDYIQNIEGIENATVAATKSVDVAGQTFQQFSVSARNAVGDFDNYTFSVDKATGSVYKMEQGMSATDKTAGKLNQTMTDQVSKFAQWAVIAELVYLPVQAIGAALDELKEVDSVMVNIQKVMDTTAGEMEQLEEKAYSVSSALGISAADYLTSVNKWAQAGYGSLSDELGELSAKTQIAGDVQADVADQFLLSVDAAYKYRGNIEALTRVLDGANEISNRYATSVEKLAGGMGIVSSLAAQAGMEVQETMAAIGTITSVTQESGNSAARALRALILNIQGETEIAVDEATGERWDEEDIEATAAALNDLNIATREYKDGVEQLRNPMEVIGELSQKYRDGLISEVQLQNIVSSLGGKTRSNQLQALISNFDMYEEMLQTYVEGIGSADREMQYYFDSWEAKSNRLRNSWVQLVESFQASDIAKGVLDLGNALLELANSDLGHIILQVTLLTAAITALSVAYAKLAEAKKTDSIVDTLKSTSGFKAIISDVGKAGGAIKGFVSAIIGGQGLTVALKTLTTSITGTLGVIGLIVAAVAFAIHKFDEWNVTTQEHIDNAEKAKSEYEEAASTIESLTTQLENNKQAIEALNAAGPLSLTDQADIDRLKTENSLLATQISLEKERQRVAAQTTFNEYSAAFEAGSDLSNSEYKDKLSWQEQNEVRGAGNVGDQIEFVIGKIETLERVMQSLGDTEADLAQKDDLQNRINNWKGLLTEIEPIFLEALDSAITLGELEPNNQAAQDFINNYSSLTDVIQIFNDAAGWATTKIDELASSSKEFASALEQVKADGTVTLAEASMLLAMFPDLKEIMDQSGFSAEDLAEHLTSAAQEERALAEGAGDAMGALDEQTDSTEALKTAAEELSNTLNTLESNLTVIKDAQDELNKTGELSNSTINNLIEQFPELTDLMWEYRAGIVSEQELQDVLKQKYEESAETYRQTILEKMMDNEEFYKNTVLTNTDIVSKLAELGITDLNNYKTVNELKEAVAERASEAITKETQEQVRAQAQAYQEDARAFAQASIVKIKRNSKVAQSMKGLVGTVGDVGSWALGLVGQNVQGAASQADSLIAEIESILSESIDIPTFNSGSSSKVSGSSGSSSSSTSAKSWYEEQIESLQNLVNITKDTNTILEREDQAYAQKQISNLQAVQQKILDMKQQFINRGLAATSDEVQQLSLMYYDLADQIESAYQSMYDDLMEKNADREWALGIQENLAEGADRTLDQIASDNAKIVAEYRSMQEDIKALSDYYRSVGYDDTDDLIQDLTDAWWDYEDKIESVYDSLTDAFEDYISESDQQIKALERTAGSAGAQIELYTKRIQEAQKAMALLQATNAGGINNDRIWNIQDQIHSDQDAISGIQEDLWDELESAVDKEFEKWQDKIDEAQKQLDHFNELVDQLDKELQDVIEPLQEQIEEWQDAMEDKLEPIEEKLEELNDRLEAEQEALENLVDPLEKQIEGYYTVNPDGTIGEYIPGINDRLDDLNDQLDEENRKWDEQQEREEQALALQRKELALQEAIKNLEQAQLDLETARNERTVYTLKDGVWAWRPDDQAIQEAEDALEDAEQAKEDAEQELEDLKEQQAHDKIIGLLEDQIEALEKQKEQIEAQIDIYEKESEARQDYLKDQIDLWEKEQEAIEDYYNALIERNEDEIEAWEDYYEAKKEQYDDDIAFWENEIKDLQAKYDEWSERWDDIQDAMTDDVRSIEEILADIAKYGTPAMKEQVDNIVDLLREMGVALGDFNTDVGGGDSGGSASDVLDIINQMLANGKKYENALTQTEKDYYMGLNQQLGASIGAQFDPSTGRWNIFDYGPGGATLKPNWKEILGLSGGSSHNDYNDWGGSSSGGIIGDAWTSDDEETDSRPNGGSGSNYEDWDSTSAGIKIEQLKSQAKNASDGEKRSLFARANEIAVAQGASSRAYTSNVSDWKWYDKRGNWLFDQGGVAQGKGVMLKDVEAPEVVLSPVLAADVLNPVSNEQFDRFAKDLGIMFGAAQNYAPDTRMERQTVVHNVDSHNVGAIINGVEIGESVLDRPLSEVLSYLGLHRNY